ncbi:MAG: Crp/Fnr family transcriptional regulator [Acidobacteria bacterium]|nr:MAG: Crp/Fnr family transcriptional regulator [Acidobacteriota bacterium]TLZ50771.1 MAG: Crp/Fnr family transcriptional regulator [Gammaproteobacteria bacterium]
MTAGGPKSRNQILTRLNAEEYKRLAPQLEAVVLSFKERIYEPGKKIEYAYFPESGVISIVKPLADGTLIETRTVGNEGMVGLAAVFGVETTSSQVFCQVPGRAIRLKADVVLAERRRGGQFAELLMRFAHATVATLAQGVACNRAHSLEERICRWLLITHDRVGEDTFPLTQEFLAQMLGVRRPTVNLAGRSLQRAGLIRYTRGKISILDRKGLEETSCECYEQIREETARSLDAILPRRKNKRS